MNKTLFALTALALAGCASDFPKNMPLIFGESITVGIGVGASATDQGGDFTLGFKSKDVAIIPVVIYDKDDKQMPAHATVTETRTNEEVTATEGDKKTVTRTPEIRIVNHDSYSVLGQFDSSTDGSNKRVGLGKFFATGNAAGQLSAGFAACLKSNNCGFGQAMNNGK